MKTPNGMHILSGERVIPVGRRDYTLKWQNCRPENYTGTYPMLRRGVLDR